MMAKTKKEDQRDADLRELRARCALLEGERHDLHELVRFFGNQNDVFRIFINQWIERVARRDSTFDVKSAVEALQAVAQPKAEALIAGHSMLRNDTQGRFVSAQPPALSGSVVGRITE
jgi:hypothetical protein